MYQLKFQLLVNGFAEFSSSLRVKLFMERLYKAQKGMPDKAVKEAITFQLLKKVLDAIPGCYNIKFEEKLLKALYVVAFHGLLRIGEVTKGSNPNTIIRKQEIVRGKNFLILKVHNAKSASKGQVQQVELIKTGDQTCPVTLLNWYLDVVADKVGPLFTYANGKRVHQNYSRRKLAKALEFAGVSKGKV